MSDTPRTDAYLEKPKVELRDGRYFYTEKFNGFVSAAFARELERELATSKKSIKTLETLLRETDEELERSINANDHLKADLAARGNP